MTDNQLTTVGRVEKTLGHMHKQFKSTLPTHISPEKFLRAAVTAVQNNQDLQQADHDSIVASCQKAATDGLLLDNREAAMVIFNTKQGNSWVKKAQYIPMVAGILKKARNSGDISKISAHVVYKNDEFEYELGLNQTLKHKPIIDGDPGDMRCAYAIAQLKDGSVQFEIMTKSQIEKIRMASKAGNDKDGKPKGIWKQWPDEMWRKTVLKRLCKYLPSSSDLDAVISYDNDHFGIDKDQDDSPPATPEKTQTKAEAAILGDDEAIQGESTVVHESENPMPTDQDII